MAKRKPDTDLVALPSQAAILQVRTWIVEGQQTADILESVRESFPKEDPKTLLTETLKELCRESLALIKDEGAYHAARGFLLNAYREIYRRAFEINDFPAAIAALRSFEKQLGT